MIYINIYDVGLRIEELIPNALNDHCFTDRLRCCHHQQFQEREFAIGEFDDTTGTPRLTCHQIELEIFVSE